MTVYYADFVRANTSTTGTGTISLGSAVSGFRTFAQAVTDGHLVSGGSVHYGIQDGTSFESGTGVYTAGSPDTLTRVVSTSSAGGTTAITLTGSAQVYITATGANLSTTAAASRSAPYRNRLHNAWHDIHQLGTSGVQGQATDRWHATNSGGTGVTWSIVTASTYFTCPPINALQVVSSVNNGNYIRYYQQIESADTYDLVGQNITISGWMNASASANTVSVTLVLGHPTSTDSSWFSATTIATVSIPATGYFSTTITNLPSGVANGLAVMFRATMSGGSATVTFQATGFQLEIGSYASTLEKRPYATELALCQRFYCTGFLYNALTSAAASGFIGAQSNFPVPMRPSGGLTLLSQANTNISTTTGSNCTIRTVTGQDVGVSIQTTCAASGAAWLYITYANQADM